MRSRKCGIAGAVLLIFIAWVSGAEAHQKKHDKNVWNYDGGMLFETDGSLPNGICFRLRGRVSAPGFFDNLKREDTEQGAVFRRGTETVTAFPEKLLVTFVIRDEPCPSGLQNVGTRGYLTPEIMSKIHFSIYWKRGVDLRAVKNVSDVRASTEPIPPYAAALEAELPKRFEWFYQLEVPAAGVPLSNSLVLILRTPDERIAARVAARM